MSTSPGDIVFDETKFPFSDLHPNAGAILQKEILLFPYIFSIYDQGGINNYDDHILADPLISTHELSDDIPATSNKNGYQIHEEISSNELYRMCRDPGSTPPSGSGVQQCRESALGIILGDNNNLAPGDNGAPTAGAPEPRPPPTGRLSGQPRHYTRCSSSRAVRACTDARAGGPTPSLANDE